MAPMSWHMTSDHEVPRMSPRWGISRPRRQGVRVDGAGQKEPTMVCCCLEISQVFSLYLYLYLISHRTHRPFAHKQSCVQQTKQS